MVGGSGGGQGVSSAGWYVSGGAISNASNLINNSTISFGADYSSEMLIGSNGQISFGSTSTPRHDGVDASVCRAAAGVIGIYVGATSGAQGCQGQPQEIQIRSIIHAGTVPGISGCSAGTQTGGGTAGTFASGTTGTCTVTLTFAKTAPTGWSCFASDVTTPANLYDQSASTTTTAVFTGTTVSGDVIHYGCVAY
jgi:hypothetical protein